MYQLSSIRTGLFLDAKTLRRPGSPDPLEFPWLPLPEPLPDEEDEPDIEPEVENEDEPLDLLPDDNPLLDEPLLDSDMDPDPEAEPDPLPEPQPDPDDALPDPELWAVAGMSL